MNDDDWKLNINDYMNAPISEDLRELARQAIANNPAFSDPNHIMNLHNNYINYDDDDSEGGMHTIKVNKSELLSKLRDNRKAHRAIFEEACEGYRKQVVAELTAMLDEAKSGKRIRRSVNLIEPIDQTKDYDRAIMMLEMSTDTIIEITQQEFAQYVMDDWSWKNQFTATNFTYMNNA